MTSHHGANGTKNQKQNVKELETKQISMRNSKWGRSGLFFYVSSNLRTMFLARLRSLLLKMRRHTGFRSLPPHKMAPRPIEIGTSQICTFGLFMGTMDVNRQGGVLFEGLAHISSVPEKKKPLDVVVAKRKLRGGQT